MTTTRNEISMLIGQDKTLQLAVSNGAGSPINLTGAVVHWRMKVATSDASALISKSSDTPAEAVVTDALKGRAEIFLVPADTASLAAGTYVYDSWVVLGGSGEQHPVIGPSPLILKPAVTVLP